MPSIFADFDWDRFRDRYLRRGGAVVLALVLEALVVMMFFIWLAPRIAPQPDSERPIMFGLDGEPAETAAPNERAEAKARSKATAERTDQPSPEPETAPPDQPDTSEALVPSNTIWLTPREYAATDVGRKRSDASAGAQGTPADSDAAEGGNMGSDTLAMGRKGPNGEPLYPAEWYREPTSAQLTPYKPSPEAEGWGDIACRTAPDHRVVDCRELDDWPRGSRLSGAVRQAAWQFRVRAPRKGGKPMIGVWVYIRITYTVTRDSR
jgi:hypothetical protein